MGKQKTSRLADLFFVSERVGRIELPSSAWKADIKAIIRYPPTAGTARLLLCAAGGNRTLTVSLLSDFKSDASTSSATAALCVHYVAPV